ncbi:MAG: Flp pilus assembly protein CpaB [Chloroflexi bacterium]|nr:MAG: Flp pilus assembly protein CpaB [Chloroflexota bacterium]
MIKGMALSNKGSKLSLILAGAFGIAAAVLIVIFLSSAKNDSGGGTSGPTLPAVVASQSIPAGTRITTDMLSLKDLPENVVLSSSLKTVDEGIGKVASVDIPSGEQVLGTRVQDATPAGQVVNAKSLAQIVPLDKQEGTCGSPGCGLRGVSVAVTEATAAAGLIRSGDRVDVIAAFKDGSSLIVVSDVEVLALDKNFDRNPSQTTEGEKSDSTKTNTGTATLALRPDEAARVSGAEEITARNQNCQGALRLALRHEGQVGTFDVPVPGSGGEGGVSCAQGFAQIWGVH